jgi:hypothetical protein
VASSNSPVELQECAGRATDTRLRRTEVNRLLVQQRGMRAEISSGLAVFLVGRRTRPGWRRSISGPVSISRLYGKERAMAERSDHGENLSLRQQCDVMARSLKGGPAIPVPGGVS